LPLAEPHVVIDKLSASNFLEAFRRTPIHKAPGIDGVPHLLLGHIPQTFLADLYNLFKAMTSARIKRHAWLQSYTTLLYKKGDHLDLANYRPFKILADLLYPF
jgi:hypothetical protein